MNAVSEALGVLAAADSAQLKAFVPVCIAVHDACEAECRKHTHHPLCIETAEACAAVTAECKKVLALRRDCTSSAPSPSNPIDASGRLPYGCFP